MRPLTVQIAMLADESSTLDCVSLSQRILRQQLELLPYPDLVVWFVCVSRKAHVTPLLEGRNERRNYLSSLSNWNYAKSNYRIGKVELSTTVTAPPQASGFIMG